MFHQGKLDKQVLKFSAQNATLVVIRSKHARRQQSVPQQVNGGLRSPVWNLRTVSAGGELNGVAIDAAVPFIPFPLPLTPFHSGHSSSDCCARGCCVRLRYTR